MGTLNGVIGKLADEGDEIRAHAADMERCIISEDAILAASAAKYTRNQAIMGATETMCDQFESEYNDAEEARQSEMGLLTALRAMVEEKLRNRVHGHGETRAD